MPRYEMVVMSEPTEGREQEYNEWYQDVHLAQLVALEGIVSARRLRRARTLGERETYTYLVIYEIETDDIDAVLKNLVEAAMDGRITMSDVIDRENAYAAVYEEFGPTIRWPVIAEDIPNERK
jgi:hypothetical protein